LACVLAASGLWACNSPAADPAADAGSEGSSANTSVDTDLTGLRLAGPSRIETAVSVSRFRYPDGADEVHLAAVDAPADALSATALGAAPLLLVPRCGPLPDVVRDELVRLQPERLIALGGAAAISQNVLDQATGTSGADDCEGSVSIFVTEQGAGEQGPYADVVISNGTDHAVTYGAAFSLARFDGEDFQELDVLDTVPGALYSVGPHEQKLLRRVGPIVLDGQVQPLPAGHYRYRLDPTSIPVLETQFTVP